MTTSENTLAGKITLPFLMLFAFGLSFSISATQLGLGIVLLVFVATLLTRAGRASLQLRAAGRLVTLYIFISLWVIWRLWHVVISPEPMRELFEAREVWLMLIPLFIFLYANTRQRLWLVACAFVVGSAISSAYGIWHQGRDFFNVWERGRGLSNMHHLNFGAVMAMAALAGLGLLMSAFYAGNKRAALVLSILTLFSFTGVWLSKSRGIIPPLMIAVALFFYFQISQKIFRRLYLTALLIGATLIISALPDQLTAQFRFPAPEVHQGSQAERRDLWQAGWAMIQAKPVTGWGERGYNLAYPPYQVPGAFGVAKYDTIDKSASHLHNDALNTWVLYGAVGLTLQLLYYFFGLGVYLRDRFKIRLESDRPLTAAGASAIILMALMGVTQCHFTSEMVQMSFWLMVAVLFTVLERDRSA